MIAILLSCFGIFAHVAYNIKRKTKEIGIRKVFGAKTGEVISLLYYEFAVMVVLASFIAIPFAYAIMSKWLENFAYRTTLSWWIFVLSAISSFGIAIITSILQTWRTARRNPVESLRYE
jgi:putative ABC transport system permease protein